MIRHIPQHLLARIIILLTEAKLSASYKNASIYTTRYRFGVSLGRCIIVSEGTGIRTIKHEYGHTLQAEKLGWLYLIVIGIPSVTLNILSRIGVLSISRYYDLWPESWADKLGEVER